MMSSPNIFGALILLPLVVQLYGHLAYCSNDRPIFLLLWRWSKPMLCQWTSPSNSLVVPSTCNMHFHHADVASISFNLTPLFLFLSAVSVLLWVLYYTGIDEVSSSCSVKNCWFLFLGCSASSKQLLTPQTFEGGMVLWCSFTCSMQHHQVAILNDALACIYKLCMYTYIYYKLYISGLSLFYLHTCRSISALS